MTAKSANYKPLPEFKLAFYVLLLISILFPLLIGYIDKQLYTLSGIVSEMAVDIILLNSIALIGYGTLKAGNKLAGSYAIHWLLHGVELAVVLFFTYWLLHVVYYVLIVQTNNITGNWENTVDFRSFIGNNLLGATFIYLLQLGLNLTNLTLQKKSESERMQQEYALIRLQALRNQVNPHFLFNSLSVLSSLVLINPEVSERFIIQLSVAYRYILDQKEFDWVKLAAELEFLDAYFFLLQIRFEQKIQLHQNINLSPEAYKLPPLTLQLLVENAVKHNKMSASEPLIISIYNEGEKLFISNNLNLRSQSESSTGIGLENIKSRYAFITKQPVQITRTHNNYRVSIPLLKI